jgi:hypothetical protein
VGPGRLRSCTLGGRPADVEPPGAAAHNAGAQEHHGNGEHPQSLERCRQVLLWRTLGFLVVFGATTGLLGWRWARAATPRPGSGSISWSCSPSTPW